MEEMPHPHTSYNKQVGEGVQAEVPTLVGNWQEERELKAVTGITRYQPWTEKGVPDRTVDLQESVYATRVHKEDADTYVRTVEHTAQVHPSNWQSVAATAYYDPKTRPTIMAYQDASLGPREKKMMEEMMREAQQLPADVEYALSARPKADGAGHGLAAPHLQHNVAPVLDSTYRAHFDEKEMTGLMIGTRVIKDRDNRPAVRDPTFLAETQIMQKANCDRILKQEAMASGATQTVTLPDPDVPITIYSEAVAKSNYSGTMTGGTRPTSKVSPFNKFDNFSKPITAYNKVVIDE